MKNQTILVTGTSGFIAKQLIKYLMQKNFNVISTSQSLGDKSIYFNFNKFSKKDLNLPKFNYLIHLAYARKNSFIEEKKINYESSKILFELAKKNKAKIIYISSFISSDISLSNYGKIKYKIENLSSQYNALIIKPGLVYNSKSLEGLFGNIKKIILNFPIVFYPSGLNKTFCLCDIEVLIHKIFKYIIDNDETIFNKLNDEKEFNLKILLYQLANDNRKKTILIPINYKIIFYVLKFLEFIHLKPKFKSDSLMSLKK